MLHEAWQDRAHDISVAALRLHPAVAPGQGEAARRHQADLVIAATATYGAIVSTVAGLQSGGSPAALLAELAVRAGDDVHAVLCCTSPEQACGREIAFVEALTASTGMIFGAVEPDLDLRSDPDAVRALTASARSTPEERSAALREFYLSVLRPHCLQREPLRIDARSPIIEFDAPIHAVDYEQWRQARRLSLRLGDIAAHRGARADVTSDHVSPAAPRYEDEAVTRTCLLRASAVVVLTRDGRLGTGRSLELGFVASIPTLVLEQVDETAPLRPRTRYDGEMTGQIPLPFRSLEDAERRLDAFLRDQDLLIHRRTAQLAQWQAEALPAAALAAVDASTELTEAHGMTRRRVRFWTQPVVWQQAPAPLRETIKAIGRGLEPASAPAPGPKAKSRRTLRVYARLQRLPIERQRALWQNYQRALATLPSSARLATTAYVVEDWAALDARLAY